MNQNIECPKCHYQFDATDSFKAQVKEEALIEARKEFIKHKNILETQQKQILSNAEKELNKKFQDEKRRVKAQLENENNQQVQNLEDELKQKSKQLQDFNKIKTEIGKLKRENDEIASRVEAQLQERLTQQLLEEKEKLRVENEKHNNMKLLEKDTVIRQLQESLKNAQLKAEQGSVQLQGEVQELAIEKWLKEQYPFDQIDEVKKGVSGADIIQIVHTRDRQNCGIIAYESKRTLRWGNDWIDKFKNDIRKTGADVGVLVTSAMPKDLNRAGVKDGVWVCTFNEFQTVSKLLRDSIVKVDIAVGNQKNREEKMAILYNYITGTGFESRIRAVVQSFTNMKTMLEKERNSMTKIWASREKELNRVIENSISIEGEIKAIAGNSLQTIDELEELANSNLLEY